MISMTKIYAFPDPESSYNNILCDIIHSLVYIWYTRRFGSIYYWQICLDIDTILPAYKGRPKQHVRIKYASHNRNAKYNIRIINKSFPRTFRDDCTVSHYGAQVFEFRKRYCLSRPTFRLPYLSLCKQSTERPSECLSLLLRIREVPGSNLMLGDQALLKFFAVFLNSSRKMPRE
jgi:hypothetical protein